MAPERRRTSSVYLPRVNSLVDGDSPSTMRLRHAEIMEARRSLAPQSDDASDSGAPPSPDELRRMLDAVLGTALGEVHVKLDSLQDRLAALSSQADAWSKPPAALRQLCPQCEFSAEMPPVPFEFSPSLGATPTPPMEPLEPPPMEYCRPALVDVIAPPVARDLMRSNSNERPPTNGETLTGARRRPSSMSASSDLMIEVYRALSRVRPRSSWSRQIWNFLEDPDMVRGGRTFLRMMSLAIVVSSFIPLLQTVEPPPLSGPAVFGIEMFLDVLFAIEVLVRFVTCPNRLVFCLSLFNLIDVAAGLLVLGLRSLSISSLVDASTEDRGAFVLVLVCSVPILRLLKLLRRFEASHLIIRAFRLTSEAMPALLFILSILVLVFASIIYIVEPRSNIESMPQAMWMTIVTVGTVGYGDIVPVSSAGSVVVASLIVISALYMSIPLGIVGKMFAAVWDDRDRLLLVHRARARFFARGYRAEDIPAIFCSFDDDSDGKLALPEFLCMMSQLQVELGGARAIELFNVFDIDGSGTIDDKEFVRTLFPEEYLSIYGTAG